MTIKYSIADVKMNERNTQQVTVGPWEIPIMMAVHGGHVKVVDTVSLEREPPDASMEYDRLANKYRNGHGEEGAGQPPYVEQVYGKFGEGIAKLDAAIQAAVVPMTRGRIDMSFEPRTAAVI